LTSPVGALRERNFRLLFVGQTASALGNTLVPVALSFGILDLTGSATDLGFVLGAEVLTLVVFILVGGVIADRIPRRTLMVSADLLRGSAQLAVGILFLVGHAPLVAFIALNALIGVGAALFQPASSGLTPALVKPEDLQQAIGLQQTSSAGAGVVGPAVAGILVVTVGPGWAIIGDAATFFVSVILLAQLSLVAIPRPERQHFLRDLHYGWKDFWGRKWFRTVVISASLFNCLYSAYVVLGPVASREHYGGAGAWAIIATSSGVGAVLGGLIATRIKPTHPLRVANLVCACMGFAPIALASELSVPVIAVAAALGGASIIIFETLWQTSVQRNVPEKVLSRASSYDWFGSLIASPIGLAVAGPLSTAFGLSPILYFIGGLLVVVFAVTLAFPSVRDLRADADPA
jgi:MFS family permease